MKPRVRPCITRWDARTCAHSRLSAVGRASRANKGTNATQLSKASARQGPGNNWLPRPQAMAVSHQAWRSSVKTYSRLLSVRHTSDALWWVATPTVPLMRSTL